jgi:hypothetical protein
MKKSVKCPICSGPIPNALHEGEYCGALSRVDNETEICSECGFMEAMQDFSRTVETAVKLADEITLARRTTILERPTIAEEA